MEHNRGNWGSNIGFLLTTIGSAVGLGNIWGFPFKMGKHGGFTFLIIYLVLSLLVGFVIMTSELALGRITGKNVVSTYYQVSKKFKWIGWLAILAPFLIMSFYSVLGGYCIEYMTLNFANLAFGRESSAGGELFGAMCSEQFGAAIATILFIIVCLLIVKGGIKDGIEKFNKVGMPALFFMLVIIIIRSLTLPGAVEGLKFMFVPDYAVTAGFVEEAPSFLSSLAAAGGQMFFSLSLAMGIIVTYGSYLSKKENIVRNSLVIVIADTIVALMAGLAVIPAAVALHGTDAALSGPSLLFVTLQDVFAEMGSIGSLFGVIFYLFVLIAAVTSAISLIEVIATYFMDRSMEKHKKPGNRTKISAWICAAIAVEAVLVAVDGLGSNGLWVPFQSFGIYSFNDCWLDFMDCISEGFFMPIGALLMSIMIGWELKPKTVLDEIKIGSSLRMDKYYTFCIRYVVPLAMLLILAGQISQFFNLNWF